MGGTEKQTASGGSNKSGRSNSSSKKRRRRVLTSSSDEESQIDQQTEERIRLSATRNNLSSLEVKNILKKVCSNDHVLALVKLKEEEMERNENLPPDSSYANSSDEPDENAFKLTRAKARALNKNLMQIPPLKIVSSDFSALIDKDLGSDEEDDDEYQPGDEEPPSDDEYLNTTASDYDSQPRTPRYSSSVDGEGVVNFTPDGLFKIPRHRTESVNSAHTVENYIIAQQTRSKVSLEGTPIENLESCFDPPDDVPYTEDQLFDHNYLEFLQDILNPAPVSEQPNASTVDEDDEDDEDFQLTSSKVITACREEMSSGRISKKEYHDLLSELFYDLPDLSEFDLQNGRNDDDTLTTPEPQPITSRSPLCTQPIEIQSIRTISSPPISIQPITNQPTDTVASVACQSIATTHMTYLCVNPSLFQPLPTFVSRIPLVEPMPVPLPIIIVTNTDSAPVPSIANARLETLHHSNRSQKELYKRLEHDKPIDYNFDNTHRGFYTWQMDILRQQIQQHVQLASQNFIQTFKHPVYSSFARTFRQFLTEMHELLERSLSLSNTINYRQAVQLVNNWEEERSIDNALNKEFMSYMMDQTVKSKQRSKQRTTYIFDFHELVKRTMLYSPVCVYPNLLPHLPFRIDFKPKHQKFMPVEDFLISLGLERFFTEQYAKLRSYKIQNVESKVKLESMCKMVATKLMPWRCPNKLTVCPVYTYVVRRRNQTGLFNPIKYYFKHKRAPPTYHILFDYRDACAPIDRPHCDLPYCWSKEAKPLKALQTDLTPNATAHNNTSDFYSPDSSFSSTKQSPTLNDESCISPKFFINVTYDQQCAARGKSPLAPHSFNFTPFSRHPCEAWSHEHSFSEQTFRVYEPTSFDTSRYTLLKGQQLITNYYSKLTDSVKVRNESQPINILKRIVHQYLHPLRHVQYLFRHRHFYLLNLYNCLITIDIYLSILVHLEMNGVSAEKRPRLVVAQSHEASAAMAGAMDIDSSAKKRKVPLLAESKKERDEKDLVFAQNYMERVEAAFIANGESYKFTDFENLLRSFDATSEKASDLYLKIEKFFLPNHPELAELFLTFLLPGEAAQIGKFMEHFLLTNMNNFVNKINIYFSKQPSQIRKIMACLTELSEEQTITIDQIKARILPLLKGNALLVEWFQQCFPSDRIGDHHVDTPIESLSFHKATETGDDPDVFEYIPQSELVADPVDNPCHIRYMNGSIYYGSRILLPAQLSFQVNSSTVQPLTTMRTARTDDSCGATYKCAHDIKRFGDMKLRMHVDNDGHLFGSSSAAAAMDTTDKLEDSTEMSSTSALLNNRSTDECEPQTAPVPIESVAIAPITTIHCPDIMLKAHAVRLNPNAHATELIRTSDLMDLLRPNNHDKNLTETPARGSPKKQSHLRAPPPPRMKPARKCAKLAGSTVDQQRQSDVVRDPAPPPPLPPTVIVAASPPLPKQWSRDEDKIVLEAIKNGFANVDELVQQLQQGNELSDRTDDEIRERFTFLMDIILSL